MVMRLSYFDKWIWIKKERKERILLVRTALLLRKVRHRPAISSALYDYLTGKHSLSVEIDTADLQFSDVEEQELGLDTHISEKEVEGSATDRYRHQINKTAAFLRDIREPLITEGLGCLKAVLLVLLSGR
jgi:hypothetical protein